MLTLLLGAAAVWSFARPDIAIWNDAGFYSHAFGWRRGSIFFRTYSAPVGPPPVEDWVAENRALPPVRRFGWSGCGVTSQAVLCSAGAQQTWTFAFPLAVPLALTSYQSLRGIAYAVGDARKDARRRRGLCPHCGYDQRATPDRCPECGWRDGESATRIRGVASG
jgi:hypothetical protein